MSRLSHCDLTEGVFSGADQGVSWRHAICSLPVLASSFALSRPHCKAYHNCAGSLRRSIRKEARWQRHAERRANGAQVAVTRASS